MKRNEFIEQLKELDPDGNLKVYLLPIGSGNQDYVTANLNDMHTLRDCSLYKSYSDWYVMPRLDGNEIVRYLDYVDINKPILQLTRGDWWDTTITTKDLLNLIEKNADGNIIIRAPSGDIVNIRKQSIIMTDFYDRKKEWIEKALVLVHV